MLIRGEVRNPEALGRVLQQGRALTGVSQRELAEQLGFSQRWLWEMEQGKPGIFTDRLFALLKATGVRLVAELEMPEDEIKATP